MPQWGPDSRELFYQIQTAAGVTMMVAANDTEPTFSAGTPVPLFEGPYAAGVLGRHHVFDVSADGERLLMIKLGEATTSPVILVQNWVEELTRLVPTEQ